MIGEDTRCNLAPSRTRRLAVATVLLAALAGGMPLAQAQGAEPPLRMVVGFPPGGTLDVITRLVATQLREAGGKVVVVENKPGAGSLIAAETVARAPGDGSTLLVAPLVVTSFFPHIHQKLNFDPLKDLVPVAQFGTFRFGLVVNASIPAKDVAGFVDYVRARPGKTSFGSVSAGTPSHFLGVMLNRSAGLDMAHVPYKGGAPAALGLQSGEVEAVFDVVTNAAPLHQAGKARILAVTGRERSTVLPDVPTFGESGAKLKDFDDASLWYGFFAPAATPPAQVARLNAMLQAVLRDPGVKARLAARDIGASESSPAGFARFVREDSARWGEVIRASGFSTRQ